MKTDPTTELTEGTEGEGTTNQTNLSNRKAEERTETGIGLAGPMSDTTSWRCGRGLSQARMPTRIQFHPPAEMGMRKVPPMPEGQSRTGRSTPPYGSQGEVHSIALGADEETQSGVTPATGISSLATASSPDRLDLSVLIPVFNEVENVEPLHAELDAVLRPLSLHYELIFVDDGSTDGTAARLEQIQARDPEHVRAAFLWRNCGQTAALSAALDLRGARSSCRWTATARTTRPTSQSCSRPWKQGMTSSRAGGGIATTPS